MKVNNFDVFRRMSDENNQAMQLATLNNITDMRKVKAGTKITIGFAGNVIAGLMNGKYVGGLILCDRAEFDRVKAEIELEP